MTSAMFPRFVLLVSLALFVIAFAGCGGGPDRASILPRCLAVSSVWQDHLESGLTAYGDTTLSDVYMVRNNDERPWVFIGGRVEADGMDEVMVWATVSLSEEDAPLLVAADSLAAEFSMWDFPGGGSERFADQFDDEIYAAMVCSEEAPEVG